MKAEEITKRRAKWSVAAQHLADADTPIIRNCWYALCRSADLGRTLAARTVAGVSVVYFRKEDGTPAALHNRCCHRSYPLDRGSLDGDTIVCGYHGLRYNACGQCVDIPHQDMPKTKFGVRDYPVIERAPFIWIWMGDADKADPGLIPHQFWLDDPDWTTDIGYFEVRGSYVHLHENLLDLSHLSYLHAATFGTPEYAAAPCDIVIEDDNIEVWRSVECVLPDVYAKPLGWVGAKARRKSGSQLVSPALHVNTGIFENLDAPRTPNDPPMVKVAQVITPIDNRNTHYHYSISRNFAVEDETVTQHITAGVTSAFKEDLAALEGVAEMHAQERPDEFFEIDIPTDRAGLEMRRRFKRWADAEIAA